MSPKAKEEMVNLTINNMPLSVPKGTRVIEAAKYVNIDIPQITNRAALAVSFYIAFFAPHNKRPPFSLYC